MAAIVIAGVIVFIAGVGAGIIAVVSAGIHREGRLNRRRNEPDFTLALQAPDRMTHNVRKVAGLHVLDLDADVDNRQEMFV
jgi:hypothetical protein